MPTPDTVKHIEEIIAWTKRKCRIHLHESGVHCREREIWWLSLGANVGDEEDGKHGSFERPVLIVKKLYGGKLLWSVPLTTSTKEDGDYYVRTAYLNDEGVSVTQYAILPQLRSISQKRLIRKLRTLPQHEFSEILQRLKKLLSAA